MRTSRLEMVEHALHVLGEVAASRIAAFVKQKFGEQIEPRFMPIFLASIRDRLRRQAASPGEPPPRRESPHPPRTVVSRSPRARDAEQLARELMTQHGLHDWHFSFNRRKQSMGLCVHSRKTIELSIHFVERDNPSQEIRDTILHEIAHALVGARHGHDRVWKRKCLEIGARPQRCGEADMPEGNWRACCQGCGKQFHRHRKPKRLRGWFCTDCGPDDGKLTWTTSDLDL